MPKHCPTVKDIVKALDGAREVASIFGLHENAVWNWTAANRLPASTYLVLQRRLADVGANAPDGLWAMRGEAQPRQTEAA